MAQRGRAPLSPWHGVVAFGLVSLAADMVYEGMRSVSGPFLGDLGASALTVGVVTGAGEAIALALRLVAGPLADRSQRHWTLTIVGYGLTAVCVPLLAIAPHIGAPGLALAVGLILLERTGKALRSPSKSVLLAGAASQVGRGRGFGVHKALDQVGAFAGPLLVAGVAALTGAIWPAFAVLAIPGAVAMALLVVLRRRLQVAEVDAAAPTPAVVEQPGRLPRSFHLLAAAVAVNTAGLMTFGIFGYHLVRAGLLPTAGVPVAYAGAMAAAAVAALATGWAYDHWSHRVLLVLPLLVAPVPALVLSGSLPVALTGLALWGAAGGVQDSTVKALVAELVPVARRGTAYGVFAAYQGAGALAGGSVAGLLYPDHLVALAIGAVVVQVLAFLPLRAAVASAGEPRPRPGHSGAAGR